MKALRFLTWTALLATTLACAGCGDDDKKPGPDNSLHGILERVLTTYHLPGIVGVTLHDDTIDGVAALGVRRVGTPGAITVNDQFHLGSNVKAMTATLLAMEVEAGHLAWERTLAQIFPEWADSMRSEYRNVTLEALLQHRSGLPEYTSLEDFLSVPEFPGSLAEQRQALAHWALQRPPGAVTGQYLYSNLGYALAGAILERSTGSTWEGQMQTRLWAPLGITTGGFGWPGAHGAAEPWGHVDRDGTGIAVPHNPDTDEQFPPVLRPAGDAFMSIGDYAKFVRLHLRGLTGHAEMLTAGTFARIHAPNGQYGLGWGVEPLDGVMTSNHIGSAGTFYIGVLMQPSRNFAEMVAINSGLDDALTALARAELDIVAAEAAP